ncbi:hypothetical protein ACPC54_15965 [Kitasatospora sp. NPDC094028]
MVDAIHGAASKNAQLPDPSKHVTTRVDVRLMPCGRSPSRPGGARRGFYARDHDPTTNPPAPQHVRIQTTGPTARLEIDGRDVADQVQVRSYELRHAAGQLPELQLLLRPNAGTA